MQEGLRQKSRIDAAQIRCLLLVGGSGGRTDALSASLRKQFEQAEIYSAETMEEAHQLLNRHAPDVVLVVSDRSTRPELGFESAIEDWLHTVPVVLHVADEGRSDGMDMVSGGAYVSVSGVGDSSTARPLTDVLTEVFGWSRSMAPHGPRPMLAEMERFRATISQVNHDIKNPLSIISGNAQLLGELAKAMGLEEDFGQPIRDIEEASQRIAGLLHRLQELGGTVPGARRA